MKPKHTLYLNGKPIAEVSDATFEIVADPPSPAQQRIEPGVQHVTVTMAAKAPTFAALEASLKKATQQFIGQPNTPETKAKVERAVAQVLNQAPMIPFHNCIACKNDKHPTFELPNDRGSTGGGYICHDCLRSVIDYGPLNADPWHLAMGNEGRCVVGEKRSWPAQKFRVPVTLLGVRPPREPDPEDNLDDYCPKCGKDVGEEEEECDCAAEPRKLERPAPPAFDEDALRRALREAESEFASVDSQPWRQCDSCDAHIIAGDPTETWGPYDGDDVFGAVICASCAALAAADDDGNEQVLAGIRERVVKF